MLNDQKSMLNTSIIRVKDIKDSEEKNIRSSKIRKDKQHFSSMTSTKLNRRKMCTLIIY